jgi:hypothetical protein
MNRRFGAMRKLIFEPAALQDHEEDALLRRRGALILDNDSLERCAPRKAWPLPKPRANAQDGNKK